MKIKRLLRLVLNLLLSLIVAVLLIGDTSNTNFIPIKTNNSDKQVINVAKISQNVVILGYHGIVDDDKIQTSSDVTEKQFRQQLNFLKANNYKVISIETYKNALENNRQLPAKSVIITLDDGYQDNKAVKILREYKLPATFFIITGHINFPKLSKFKKFTLQDIKEIDADPLFSVYSHGKTHAYLTTLSLESLSKELDDSRKFLEDNLGGKRDIIAYPYGAFNSNIRSIIGKYYFLGLGVSGNYKDILNQPRYLIGYSTTPDIVTFRRRLNDSFLKKKKLAMKVQ